MKRIFLIVLFSLILSGCGGCVHDQFQINTKIHPKFSVLDNGKISVEYKLGNILVVDELSVKDSIKNYIISNKPADLNLMIKSADTTFVTYSIFTYYLDQKEIGSNSDVVPLEILKKNYDSIPNFVWIVRNGNKRTTKVLEQNNEKGMKKL